MLPRRQQTARFTFPFAASVLEELSWEQLWELHRWGAGNTSDVGRRTSEEGALPSALPLDPSLPPDQRANLLQVKSRLARAALRNCHLCERHCGIDRLAGEIAYCGVAEDSYVGSEYIHMGEEEELVPSYAVYLAGCTFRCVYCQAHRIAFNPKAGWAPSVEEFVALIGERQRQGARNVNFIGGTPEPHVATIVSVAAALPEAVDIPFVMNCNMSMTPLALRLLEGVIDLYLADFRHGNDDCAKRLMDVDRYTAFVTRNLLQAARGADLLVRVLVLPNHLECCLRPILEWIATHLPQVHLNVMFQYRPCFEAWNHPDLARQLNEQEKATALRWCEELGLRNRVPAAV